MNTTYRLANKSKAAFNSLKTAQILSQVPSANYFSMNFTKSMLMNNSMKSNFVLH